MVWNWILFPFRLAFIGFLLTSCTTPGPSMGSKLNTWLGKPKSLLIQHWGPPSKTDSDGKGGEVLSYVEQVNVPAGPTVYNRVGNSVIEVSDEASNYARTRQMYVSPKGVIYFWRYEGY